MLRIVLKRLLNGFQEFGCGKWFSITDTAFAPHRAQPSAPEDHIRTSILRWRANASRKGSGQFNTVHPWHYDIRKDQAYFFMALTVNCETLPPAHQRRKFLEPVTFQYGDTQLPYHRLVFNDQYFLSHSVFGRQSVGRFKAWAEPLFYTSDAKTRLGPL
jgi:hypothetical protein